MDFGLYLAFGIVFALGFLAGRWTRTPRLALAVLVAAGEAWAGPGEAMAAAYADAKAAAEPQHYRYLGDWGIPAKYRGNFQRLQNVQINQRSREAELYIPVTPGDVYRIDLRELGWTAELWERLLDAPEPYFHADEERKVVKVVRGKRQVKIVKVRRLSPHFDTPQMNGLIALTGSQVPIVSAPWFFVQTAIQEDRALGYYDLLGLANRNDYFKLIGLDKKLAQQRKSEIAAQIKTTGIARFPRQIFRFGVVDGGGWETHDVLLSGTGKKNAISQLDKDFDHDVEEHIGPLPCGLLASFLCNKAGVRQDAAPSQVGFDRRTTSNDPNIHIGLCWRCHQEGLRPIDDYARKYDSGPLALAAADYATFKRLRQLYHSDLQNKLIKDNFEYARKLREVSGWTPQQYSAALTDWWQWANDAEVTIDQAALEYGCEPGELRAALIRHGLAGHLGVGRVDRVFAVYIADPPGTMRREHFDEHFQRGLNVVRGAVSDIGKVKR